MIDACMKHKNRAPSPKEDIPPTRSERTHSEPSRNKFGLGAVDAARRVEWGGDRRQLNSGLVSSVRPRPLTGSAHLLSPLVCSSSQSTTTISSISRHSTFLPHTTLQPPRTSKQTTWYVI